jgi:hypothetical protein
MKLIKVSSCPVNNPSGNICHAEPVSLIQYFHSLSHGSLSYRIFTGKTCYTYVLVYSAPSGLRKNLFVTQPRPSARAFKLHPFRASGCLILQASHNSIPFSLSILKDLIHSPLIFIPRQMLFLIFQLRFTF